MKRLHAPLSLALLLCSCAGSGSDATADYPEFVKDATMPTYDPAELAGNITYPARALDLGIEGTVYVQAKINEKGKMVEAVVVKRVDPQLDEAALDAVRKTTFTPAMLEGEPIRMRIMIPIKFLLSTD
jgi:TonB family protein